MFGTFIAKITLQKYATPLPSFQTAERMNAEAISKLA
jgi:hypothetical protein